MVAYALDTPSPLLQPRQPNKLQFRAPWFFSTYTNMKQNTFYLASPIFSLHNLSTTESNEKLKKKLPQTIVHSENQPVGLVL